jgi:predicted ATPase
VRVTATSFIGRADELARLAGLFDGGARLVTVLGPPGIGKTRLAQHWAGAESGARFVDLTEARDRTDLEQLASFDSARDTVLVLDNFEQLVEHAPALSRWLADAPELRLLVTSREQLRIDGEHTLVLAPLEPAEAARLFADRAHGYELRDTDAPYVDRIVRRLEGIPLAIELAASRTPVLSPAQLADRLDKQFEVLTGGARGDNARHATLRGAIDWSWSLLAPHEQATLAQCSVFRGGFPIDAAEAVIDISAHAGAPPLLDVLQSLTEKSLVRSVRLPDSGENRFSLYESIRELAAERLGESGEQGTTVFRHSAYYARMSREIGARVVAPSGMSFVGQLEVELDNLVYAFESMLDDPEALRRAAGPAHRNTLALQDVVSGRGKLGAFDALRDAAIDLQAAADARDAARLRAETLRIIGTYYGVFGRPDDAHAYFARAVKAARAAGERTRGRALYGWGTFCLATGKLDQGRRHLDDARAIGEREADAALLGRVLAQYGNLNLRQRRPEQAVGLFEQAIAIARSRGDDPDAIADEGLLLGNLGVAHQECGDLEAAADCFAQAREIHGRRGDPQRAGGALGYLGTVFHEQGDFDRALEHYELALAQARRAGARRSEALFLCWMGSVYATCGEHDAARTAFETAESKSRDVGDGGLFTTLSLHRASLLLAGGDRAGARRAVDDAAARLDLADGRARPVSAADQSDDLRFGLRVLERELSANAFAVARDGSWFERPGGERVSLAQRHRLRRLLAALVDHYVAEPGAPMSLHALIESGWPGERMDPESGINRVHVALTTLRKIGLRELITRDEDGYYLDANAALVVR